MLSNLFVPRAGDPRCIFANFAALLTRNAVAKRCVFKMVLKMVKCNCKTDCRQITIASITLNYYACESVTKQSASTRA